MLFLMRLPNRKNQNHGLLSMNGLPENAWLPPKHVNPVSSVNLEERLAFLELTGKDRLRLHQLAQTLQPSAGDFVQAFYQHLLAFEGTAHFLQEPELVERLKVSQQRHLESMLQADWNQAYVQDRHHVGDAHAQVGILPDIFLGAYVQYVKYCLGQLSLNPGGDTGHVLDQVLSLLKAIFLDVGLTLDAYFEQSTQSLRKALELLLTANSELRQFAHLTSHDLKTPLATVANLCDETIDEFGMQMPDEARNLIAAARNRVFRMSATIDELLTSTINVADDLSDEEFSTQHVVADILEQLRPALREKEIEVIVSPNLPSIAGDQARIREAFYNILSNAVKFIERRPGRITVDAQRRNRECIFSFADNGPGIPSDELDRIFLPFRRLRTHHNVPGSGLGLYFTKSLIEQHQGRVWVESEVGKGSRFFIALPCPAAEPAQP
jgi:signal transduction histidine kinase